MAPIYTGIYRRAAVAKTDFVGFATPRTTAATTIRPPIKVAVSGFSLRDENDIDFGRSKGVTR